MFVMGAMRVKLSIRGMKTCISSTVIVVFSDLASARHTYPREGSETIIV